MHVHIRMYICTYIYTKVLDTNIHITYCMYLIFPCMNSFGSYIHIDDNPLDFLNEMQWLNENLLYIRI